MVPTHLYPAVVASLTFKKVVKKFSKLWLPETFDDIKLDLLAKCSRLVFIA